MLRDLLADVGAEGEQVVLVCDADGTLLWIDGDQRMLDEATGVHLMRGARWSEADAGTNAMGTALALDHSLQVFSAEHFATPVHGWTCSAAPLHDPRTGQLLGVLDLSGPLQTAHPHSLALVGAAARMVETVLAQRPVLALPARSTQGRVAAARWAATAPRSTLADGRTVTLSRRHSELMVLLALRPDGMTAEEIAIALHGDFGKPVTARAELSRLRRILGRRAAGRALPPRGAAARGLPGRRRRPRRLPGPAAAALGGPARRRGPRGARPPHPLHRPALRRPRAPGALDPLRRRPRRPPGRPPPRRAAVRPTTPAAPRR